MVSGWLGCGVGIEGTGGLRGWAVVRAGLMVVELADCYQYVMLFRLSANAVRETRYIVRDGRRPHS